MQIKNIIDRIKLPFRKEKELYLSLHEIIGFYPHNISYYKQALLHKSMARRNEKGRPLNNERLEFLGDALLDAVVGDIVFHHFEGKREGFLTNTRSKIVQRETLGKLAQEMGLNSLIKSNGHTSSHNSYMGGNAFEALVGAIYLDQGYEACKRFMERRILKELINIDKVAYKEVNFKSKLLEWSQKNRVKVDYKLTCENKDEKGNSTFTYTVILENVEGERGEGYSKKEAQQIASRLTMQRLRKEPQFIDMVFASKEERKKHESALKQANNMEEIGISNNSDNQGNQSEQNAKSDEGYQDPPKTPSTSVSSKKTAKKDRRKSKGEGDAPIEYFREDTPMAMPVVPTGYSLASNQDNTTDDKHDDKVEIDDEYDLSDINTSLGDNKSREDIIAAAEAAAFADN